MADAYNAGDGRSSSTEEMSDQQNHSENSLSEWRSSQQVENGVPSTSPSYSDTADDDCGSGYAPTPINRLVMCPNERKRDRDRARYVAMSTEQRVLQNKRRRELYATENTPKKYRNDATNDSKGDCPANRNEDMEYNLAQCRYREKMLIILLKSGVKTYQR